MKQIENDPERLNMLSLDRLETLSEYYSNIIYENNIKIERLKKKIG